MQLPHQPAPVRTNTWSQNAGAVRRDGITTSSCAGVPTNILGKCSFSNGTNNYNFNCAACCAQRTALSWIGGGYAVACH